MFKNIFFDNLYYMTKNIFSKIMLVFVVAFLSINIFSGCSSGAVNYYITNFPERLVYEVGEEVDLSGLKVESINSDGTNTMVSLKDAEISKVDTSTSGVKKVKISKGKLSTVYNVYVADIVITDSDNLKQKFASAQNGDIIYLKQGSYTPKNDSDTSYQNVVVDKSLIIVGDGKDKTKFAGNFIVGATETDGQFSPIDLSGIKFINIGFEIKYQQENGFLKYSGPYGKTDKNGALNIFNTSDILVYNCSFAGYAYGILGGSVEGLTVKNNSFKNILLNGIKTTKNTQNTTIFKNVFMDIASNVIASENQTQLATGCLELSFAKEGNAGVSIANNTFTRTGLSNKDVIYYDEQSKTYAQQTKEQIFKMSYINNSAIVTLRSSTIDDLLVDGIVLSNNNYGQTLTNIRLNTTSQDTIDQNGVMIIETY